MPGMRLRLSSPRHRARTPIVRANAAVAVAFLAAAVAGSPAAADPYTDNEWASFRAGATPGMTLGITTTDGKMVRCTSAFAAKDSNGDPVVFTAGHCFPATARSSVDYGVIGERGSVRMARLGSVESAQSRSTQGGKRTVDWSSDFAVIRVDPSVTPVARIADTYTVTEVMTADRITTGMTLCKYGYRTQETCGPVISGDNGFVRAALFSMTGDSGSPAYVKLGGDKVAAVGLLSSSPRLGAYTADYVTDFALIAPVVYKLQINLSR